MTPVTNATAEGLNSRITAIKQRACGFRNPENFKTAIYCYSVEAWICTHAKPGRGTFIKYVPIIEYKADTYKERYYYCFVLNRKSCFYSCKPFDPALLILLYSIILYSLVSLLEGKLCLYP
ncbi:MAG: transposase [bacterium]|nr:transposase [bacterium]